MINKIRQKIFKTGEVERTPTKLEEVESTVENGDIPTSGQVTRALNETLSAPIDSCAYCDETGSASYEGNEAARFLATKNIARKVMDDQEVRDMENLAFSDKNTFCPKFDSLTASSRKDFWASLIAVMGQYESKNRPSTSYDEGRSDRRLAGVTSVGILQMSYASARQTRYARQGCQLSQPRQLYDPTVNIRCGLAAMKGLILRDGCIACGHNKGAADYWSVLRDPYRAGGLNLGKKPQIVSDLKRAKPDCF